jgi:hypothetical protein
VLVDVGEETVVLGTLVVRPHVSLVELDEIELGLGSSVCAIRPSLGVQEAVVNVLHGADLSLEVGRCAVVAGMWA